MHRNVNTNEEALEKYGKIIDVNVGISMLPMLRQHKDLVIIVKRPNARLKKYDVVLYRRDDRYILHRILKVREDDYVICGDHNWRREYGITDDMIIGVLEAFVRNGEEILVTNRRYLCYVHLWCDFYYLRALILWWKHILKKMRRNLKTILKNYK